MIGIAKTVAFHERASRATGTKHRREVPVGEWQEDFLPYLVGEVASPEEQAVARGLISRINPDHAAALIAVRYAGWTGAQWGQAVGISQQGASW